MKILWKNIENREILIASPDPKIQNAINSLDIFDNWKNKEKNFIYPIFTSIGRNKTDRLMQRTFTIREIDACKREVTLTQKH